MSSYRNLTQWNKANSTSSSKLSSPYKRESSCSIKTSESDAKGKLDDEKKSTATLRIPTPKYGNTAYNAGYQRNTTLSSASKDKANYSNRSELPRLKAVPDNKDSSLHPPISYRPLTKNTTTTRSRDPSPVAVTDRSTSSSSTSYNRLIPPTANCRSVSRERTNSTSSIGSISSTIPKYSGRSSLNQDDLTSSKKYPSYSKADRYDESTTKFRNIGRTVSREDLTASSKYITSRFLRKNTIEKSYGTYSRGSTSLAKANEASRKNRELLKGIQAQQERERSSRSVSRCSSINFDDISPKSSKGSTSESNLNIEGKTLNIVCRGTSPTPSKTSLWIKSEGTEISQTSEKQVIKTKLKAEMVDKAIQSYHLEDNMKNSKLAEPSKVKATSWNSELDLKFSSPSKKILSKSTSTSSESSSSEHSSPNRKKVSAFSSPSLEKSNAIKCQSHSCVPEEKFKKPKTNKNERKLLPPQIPTRDSSVKSLSSGQQNKDFRKSILNMSDMAKKRIGRRSNSVSSADSESDNVKDPDATDISENLTSSKSFHSSLVSKLPQKMGSENNFNTKSRRSPSSELSLSLSSANASGNEDDTKIKSEEVMKTDDEFKQHYVSNEDNAHAKSFIKRELAPVTNFFKVNEEPGNNLNQVQGSCSEDTSGIEVAHLKDTEIESHIKTLRVPQLRHVPSGEIPWWLDENGEVPEGIEIYPNWVKEDNSTTVDSRVIYNIRRNESGKSSWWNDSSENSESNKSRLNQKNSCVSANNDENATKFPRVRRNNSTKSIWWVQSSDNSNSEHNNLPDGEYMVQKDENGRISYRKKDSDGDTSYMHQGTDENGRKQYKIRRCDSTKSSWWLDSSDSSGHKKNPQEDGNHSPQQDRFGSIPHIMKKIDPAESCSIDNYKDNLVHQENQKTLDLKHFELHKIRHIDSGERAWWLSSQENIAESSQGYNQEEKPLITLRHQDYGEPAWWLQESGENDDQICLGDRTSPEGLEMPNDEGRSSLYADVSCSKIRPDNLFISKHTNIDDILGGSSQMWSPLMDRIFNYQGDSAQQSNGGCIEGRNVVIERLDSATEESPKVEPAYKNYNSKFLRYVKAIDQRIRSFISLTDLYPSVVNMH